MARTHPLPREQTREAGLDDALADTFPASDPPAHSNPVKGTRVNREPGEPRKRRRRTGRKD